MLQLKSPGKFSVSKWLKHQVLLDVPEMEELCGLGFRLYNVSEIAPFSELEISLDQFLSSYRNYIDLVKQGKATQERHFSCALSVDPESLYAVEIQPGKFMAKLQKPVVQMQQHRFFFSTVSEVIQPMVMSQESIHWGIQFAYPQIFDNNGVFTKVTDFPNTALFTAMMRWIRSNTIPATFVYNDKKIATPLRLGKKWNGEIPQLKAHDLRLHVY